MLNGGVSMLAESSTRNIQRLRAGGIECPVMMLRLPAISEVKQVVELCSVSLNSELETLQALNCAAKSAGLIHQVILMIEIGDRREGIMPEDALALVRSILGLKGLDLIGVGANTACVGGVLPSAENMRLLVNVAYEIEVELGLQLQTISGGNTANLALLKSSQVPDRINQLRVGEGILLGVSESNQFDLPCPYKDSFMVTAEVIELKVKPSMPEGEIAIDAFGRKPHWQDIGQRKRAILALGEQHMRIGGLKPLREGVFIVGASSDHTVMDVTDANPTVSLGETLEFIPQYSALATAMTSESVIKTYMD
jgi:predicted amino acid racemase